MTPSHRRTRLCATCLIWLWTSALAIPVATMARALVHSHFGAQIFGFNIDQNATEGALSESQEMSGDTFLAAVETFDQATGKILTAVAKTMSKDDFVTLGIADGNGGSGEQEQV